MSNNNTGAHGPGRIVTMGTKTATVNGTSYSIPCDSSSDGLAWSSTNGTSIGIARDFDFGTQDLIWASITGTNADTTAADSRNVAECTAAAGHKCIGVATYDFSSGTLARYFHPTFDGEATATANPDVLGYGTRAVAVNKVASGNIYSYPTNGSGTADTLSSSHTSQLEWVDGTYFVATATAKTNCNAGSPELELWNASLIDGVRQAHIAMPHNTGKPEGVAVVKLTAGNRGSCGLVADYAVYVADYCEDELYVYALNLTGATSTFTLKATVDLYSGSSYTGVCAPSSVMVHGTSEKAFVTCQTRETIERIDVADLCNPDAGFEDEAALEYAVANANASCGSTPSLTTCIDDGGACAPHDIDSDDSIAAGWLFVNLSERNQTIVVRRTNLADQAAFYKQYQATIKPFELSLASSP